MLHLNLYKYHKLNYWDFFIKKTLHLIGFTDKVLDIINELYYLSKIQLLKKFSL